MPITKAHKAALSKLQKKVKLLQRKEKVARHKLHAALAEAKEVAKRHRAKIAAVESAVYEKIAASMKSSAKKAKKVVKTKKVKTTSRRLSK